MLPFIFTHCIHDIQDINSYHQVEVHSVSFLCPHYYSYLYHAVWSIILHGVRCENKISVSRCTVQANFTLTSEIGLCVKVC